jgi:hypothetical protein
MTELEVSNRLSAWAKLRQDVNSSDNPLLDVWDYWHSVPFIAYNHRINPHDSETWGSPWEIIAENVYDDFTMALMMAWTLKLTKKFENVKITIQTMVDKQHSRQYNIVCVEDYGVINYSDAGPVPMNSWPDSFSIDNIVEVHRPT